MGRLQQNSLLVQLFIKEGLEILCSKDLFKKFPLYTSMLKEQHIDLQSQRCHWMQYEETRCFGTSRTDLQFTYDSKNKQQLFIHTNLTG